MGIKFSKDTPYSKLKSSQSDTLDFTGPFILRLMSRTKPMVTNIPSNINNLYSTQCDMNEKVLDLFLHWTEIL